MRERPPLVPVHCFRSAIRVRWVPARTRQISPTTARWNTVRGAAQALSGSISGVGALVKDTGSSSVLTLSGSNSYSGGATLSSGTLQFAHVNAMPATGTVSILTGSTLAVNAGGTGEFTTGTTGAGTIGGLLSGTGGQGAAVTYSGAVTLGIDTSNAGAPLTYAGNIGDVASSLGIAKLGSGTLILAASNSYSGGTTVNGGTLGISGGTLGNGGALALSGGQLDLGGTSQTVGAVTMTAAASGNTIQNGTLIASSYTASNATGNVTISANLAGSGGFTLSGAGTVTFTGSNSYSGTTALSTVGGSLQYTVAGGNSGGGAIALNLNSTTLTVNTSGAVSASGLAFNNSHSNEIVNLTAVRPHYRIWEHHRHPVHRKRDILHQRHA